jgi:hypothetical protein
VQAIWTEPAWPLDYEHGRIAANLLSGKGFSVKFLGQEGPTSQQAPIYPFLLAGAYACLGVETPAAVLAVEAVQCLAGTALVLAVVWLAWTLVPDRPAVGWIAGLGAAVYPSHLYMVTHLQVAVWAALVLTLLVAVVVSPRWRATWSGAVLAGCLAGALLLIEPILCLALPVCALVFWLAEPAAERWSWAVLGRLSAMAGVALLVIAPWLVRNRLVHGEFVFIKSTLGYAFWQGNHPLSWGTDKVPRPAADALRQDHDGTLREMNWAMWNARYKTLYIDDLVFQPFGYGQFAGMSEPERCRVLGRQGWQYVRDDPARYGRLCLQRLRYFLLFDETNPKAANWLYRLTTVAWLLLALAGIAVSLRRWRQLWPTYAIFGLVLLFHSLVIVSARFRIPVEPLSFVWAALAVTALLGLFWPKVGSLTHG